MVSMERGFSYRNEVGWVGAELSNGTFINVDEGIRDRGEVSYP